MAVKSGGGPKPVPASKKTAPTRIGAGRLRKLEQRSGCLGGLMYFLFIFCLALGIAFFAWMAASDVLALNKKTFTTTVTLPAESFTAEQVETYDSAGAATGFKTISHASIPYVAKALKEAGLIQYEWLFELYCNLSHADTKFDPGEYELKSSFDYRALVQNMRIGAGGIGTVDVTIPEGFTMQDIFRRFDENGVASYETLMEAAENGDYDFAFIETTKDEGAGRLEGYLFPDTYQFYRGMEGSTAIGKLLKNFGVKYTTDMITQTVNMGYSVKDIITIASIIEKEAALDEDRAFVSSVIYNRMRSGMTLGMDTTILYVFQEHEGEPTQEMLDYDSPYNTHIYSGLPPTPICNPGLASINAALNPEQSDYYYFYADIETGKLNFFTNYNDFNAYAESHPN